MADLEAPTSAPAAPASAAATAAAEDAERKTPKAKAVPTLESSGNSRQLARDPQIADPHHRLFGEGFVYNEIDSGWEKHTSTRDFVRISRNPRRSFKSHSFVKISSSDM